MAGDWWDEKDRLKREKARLEKTSMIPYVLAGVVFLYISALAVFAFVAKRQWDEGNKTALSQEAAEIPSSATEGGDAAPSDTGDASGLGEPGRAGDPEQAGEPGQSGESGKPEETEAEGEPGEGRKAGAAESEVAETEIAAETSSVTAAAKPDSTQASETEASQAAMPKGESSARKENRSGKALGERTDAERVARVLLRNMSMEEKVAQLFFVSPEALTGTEEVTRAGDATREAFEKYPVGGIMYARENLWNDAQATELLSEMQAIARERSAFPVFLGVVEAGGSDLSVASNSAFDQVPPPSMQALSEDGEAETVRAMGAKIGAYLADLGFNMDFAPNADVLTEPGNALGDRSFGSDPEKVSEYAWAFAEGLHDGGVLACYMHYPGQGGTRADTHEGYAYTYKTATELVESELLPFEKGGKKGLEAILVSHIAVPCILADDTPSSLSSRMVDGLLRKELGFEGLVIADDLNDAAIRAHYEPGEAASLAFAAGCDMLLLSGDFEKSYEKLLSEVQSGSISEDRLDESVYKILKTKLSMAVGISAGHS